MRVRLEGASQKSSTLVQSEQELPIMLSVVAPKEMGSSEIQPRVGVAVETEDLLSASCCFPKHKQRIVEEIKPSRDPERVALEMEKTQGALDNLTSLLRKPKKKYSFFNKSLEVSLTKPNERTSLSLCEKEPRATEWRELEESVDCTATDESRDTAEFLEDAIGDHMALKKALVELEENTQLQMREMKDYYENEIKMYVELLSKEKDPSGKEMRLNSTRIHLNPEDQENI